MQTQNAQANESKRRNDMATDQDSVVVGVFDDRARATQAVEELKRDGFTDDQIGIAYRDPQASTSPSGTAVDTDSAEPAPSGSGAVSGAVGGGILGGILGAAAALLIPGIGPVIAGGILAAALGGAAIGAAAGGLLGALTNMGVPEEEARYYEGEFQSGHTIVTVQAKGRRQEALDILRQYGAYDATNRTAGAASGMTAYEAPGYTAIQTTNTPQAQGRPMEGAQNIQLREEQLTPVKQATQAGEVELHKVVHEKEQEIPVNLRHEEVTIDRRVVDRPAEPGEIGAKQDEVIRVPVYKEQAELQKQARVREEVGIGKRTVEEQQTMTGTVRHEHLQVEQSGDVNVQGDVDNVDTIDSVDTTRAEDRQYTD
jgi:uncharacterized protein (TIGR02271 family)